MRPISPKYQNYAKCAIDELSPNIWTLGLVIKVFVIMTMPIIYNTIKQQLKFNHGINY